MKNVILFIATSILFKTAYAGKSLETVSIVNRQITIELGYSGNKLHEVNDFVQYFKDRNEKAIIKYSCDEETYTNCELFITDVSDKASFKVIDSKQKVIKKLVELTGQVWGYNGEASALSGQANIDCNQKNNMTVCTLNN